MLLNIGKKTIGDGNPVYFIAEIGVNHCGDINLAKKMVLAAKRAGADAVKFQTFQAESYVTPNTPKVKYQKKTTTSKETHYEMIKSLELSNEKHEILFDFCKKNKIKFLSTPYDRDSAIFLNKIGCDTFKTASADIVDLYLHTYLAKTGKTVIISTGMANIDEIKQCVEIYRKNSNKNFILLHCTSNYPCSDQSLNMSVLPKLASKFNCLVGYSDHSIGIEASVISVALGGVLIEKHFTTDRKLPGPDQKTSVLPKEFSEMIKAVKKTKLILGNDIKKCQPEEINMARVSRKSLTLKNALNKGDILKKKNIILKRPGIGLFPKDLKRFLGLKAVKNLEKNYQIKFKDFK
jgi:sialic acid synthase SpsE